MYFKNTNCFLLCRKSASLLSTYTLSHNPRKRHFVRHSDVKPDIEEKEKYELRPPTNDRKTLQNLQGWKVVHVGNQVEELKKVEEDICDRLNNALSGLEKKKLPDSVVANDVYTICELIKANIQRSKNVQEQMCNVEVQLEKLLGHKDAVSAILAKQGSKRQLRKKKRTKRLTWDFAALEYWTFSSVSWVMTVVYFLIWGVSTVLSEDWFCTDQCQLHFNTHPPQ